MHYDTVTTILLTITPAFSLGIPALITREIPVDTVGNAQLFWAGDTSLVSQFLSMAPSLSGQDLANAAASALTSEGDELTQKGVLDAVFRTLGSGEAGGALTDITAANTTLVEQGTFQFVVNGLNDLVINGADFSPDQVLSSVTMINTVRCNSVLPAIDIYLGSAAVLSGRPFPNVAVRPDNCP
ncbi:uncharacterized protein A1O5_12662 [Cladophialophora psammophila CBS 110553]|uniref:Uncharacterized protein n=1 Tax=Cladophialophora psammophila CBS 110553 TaxID=1182543 RepID=W9VVH6_9EURO|nr:uncharacterized protein A1O5_12662 [Cladophialophora psammophila CBS 110553]EXJ56206.1 hypothetical protein A1O5_12662 [Cladophialophora psammophila CBS 110553]